jgi:biopolymer transport protein ExbB/TolQ
MAVVPKVIKAGLMCANKGEVEIQNAIEEASFEVVPRIQKRINALNALANVATLLGLLGTILGLIEAFEALEKATPENRQKLLARGIALAMNTTAFGLIVAIPSLVAHLILSGQTKRLLDEIDLYSVKLENLLVSRGKGGMIEE